MQEDVYMSQRWKGEFTVPSKNSIVSSTSYHQLEEGLNSSCLGEKDNNWVWLILLQGRHRWWKLSIVIQIRLKKVCLHISLALLQNVLSGCWAVDRHNPDPFTGVPWRLIALLGSRWGAELAGNCGTVKTHRQMFLWRIQVQRLEEYLPGDLNLIFWGTSESFESWVKLEQGSCASRDLSSESRQAVCIFPDLWEQESSL